MNPAPIFQVLGDCFSLNLGFLLFCLLYIRIFNTLQNNKILDWSKLKAFANNNLDVSKKMISVYDRVESIVGKRENAGNQHFLLFPQCCPKASSKESLKVGIMW